MNSEVQVFLHHVGFIKFPEASTSKNMKPPRLYVLYVSMILFFFAPGLFSLSIMVDITDSWLFMITGQSFLINPFKPIVKYHVEFPAHVRYFVHSINPISETFLSVGNEGIQYFLLTMSTYF